MIKNFKRLLSSSFRFVKYMRTKHNTDKQFKKISGG